MSTTLAILQKKKSIEVMGQVLLFPVFQIKKGGLREFEQFALLGKEKKTHQFYFFLREYCMLDFEPVHLFVPYQALWLVGSAWP